MNEFFCHFWVLAATHLVAAPVVLSLGFLLRGVAGRLVSLIPGLEARSVRGVWKATFHRDTEAFEERADVSQFLRWVWGTITDLSNNRLYSFRGRLRENVFVAVYEVKGESSVLDLGAFTLGLAFDGKTLEGRYSWIDSTKKDLHGDRYVWTKVG